ncbi:MAG: HEPN domain-containing protein [Anaerolineales bacterium]|nr:HEPN domain-containing protein [Anaerolineales bacterium]MDW8445894.1 HEPN domain-containing protein [Anaerolineales bacterium]
MASRAKDWLAQAEHDLRHAQNAMRDGDYDWACFAAHQGAEKAVKALLLARGAEGWGHSVLKLLRELESAMPIPAQLFEAGRRLDRHYIPTRYPNGFDWGSPKDYLWSRGCSKGRGGWPSYLRLLRARDL